MHDIAHVIIDNVQFMMGMTDEPNFIDRYEKKQPEYFNFNISYTKFIYTKMSYTIYFMQFLDFGDRIKLYQFFEHLPQNLIVMYHWLFIPEKKEMMEN